MILQHDPTRSIDILVQGTSRGTGDPKTVMDPDTILKDGQPGIIDLVARTVESGRSERDVI